MTDTNAELIPVTYRWHRGSNALQVTSKQRVNLMPLNVELKPVIVYLSDTLVLTLGIQSCLIYSDFLRLGKKVDYIPVAYIIIVKAHKAQFGHEHGNNLCCPKIKVTV